MENGFQLYIVLGDITKVAGVEAIVNAANKTLMGGSGVDGAIHKAAGWRLRKECLSLHGCRTGEAKLTQAYELPCDFVIRTVGPVWKGGARQERERLAECYANCLDLARAHSIRSIAFPSISTGAYGFPVEDAARVAMDEVKKFVADDPEAFDKVAFVLFDEATEAAYTCAAECVGLA